MAGFQPMQQIHILTHSAILGFDDDGRLFIGTVRWTQDPKPYFVLFGDSNQCELIPPNSIFGHLLAIVVPWRVVVHEIFQFRVFVDREVFILGKPIYGVFPDNRIVLFVAIKLICNCSELAIPITDDLQFYCCLFHWNSLVWVGCLIECYCFSNNLPVFFSCCSISVFFRFLLFLHLLQQQL